MGAAAALACLAETKRLNVVDNAAARGGTQLYDGMSRALQGESTTSSAMCVGGHGHDDRHRDGQRPRHQETNRRQGPQMTVQEVAYQSRRNGARISGPNIILSPPLILTEQDADLILAALDTAFTAVSS